MESYSPPSQPLLRDSIGRGFRLDGLYITHTIERLRFQKNVSSTDHCKNRFVWIMKLDMNPDIRDVTPVMSEWSNTEQLVLDHLRHNKDLQKLVLKFSNHWLEAGSHFMLLSQWASQILDAVGQNSNVDSFEEEDLLLSVDDFVTFLQAKAHSLRALSSTLIMNDDSITSSDAVFEAVEGRIARAVAQLQVLENLTLDSENDTLSARILRELSLIHPLRLQELSLTCSSSHVDSVVALAELLHTSTCLERLSLFAVDSSGEMLQILVDALDSCTSLVRLGLNLEYAGDDEADVLIEYFRQSIQNFHQHQQDESMASRAWKLQELHLYGRWGCRVAASIAQLLVPPATIGAGLQTSFRSQRGQQHDNAAFLRTILLTCSDMSDIDALLQVLVGGSRLHSLSLINMSISRCWEQLIRTMPQFVHLIELTVHQSRYYDNQLQLDMISALIRALRTNGSLQHFAVTGTEHEIADTGESVLSPEQQRKVQAYCQRNGTTAESILWNDSLSSSEAVVAAAELEGMDTIDTTTLAATTSTTMTTSPLPAYLLAVQPAVQTAPNTHLAGLLATLDEIGSL